MWPVLPQATMISKSQSAYCGLVWTTVQSRYGFSSSLSSNFRYCLRATLMYLLIPTQDRLHIWNPPYHSDWRRTGNPISDPSAPSSLHSASLPRALFTENASSSLVCCVSFLGQEMQIPRSTTTNSKNWTDKGMLTLHRKQQATLDYQFWLLKH